MSEENKSLTVFWTLSVTISEITLSKPSSGNNEIL